MANRKRSAPGTSKGCAPTDSVTSRFWRRWPRSAWRSSRTPSPSASARSQISAPWSSLSPRDESVSTRRLRERLGAGDRDVFVDLRAVAADPDGPDDLTGEQDRDPTLQRSRIGERQGGHAAVADLVLENLAGPPIDGRSAGLA